MCSKRILKKFACNSEETVLSMSFHLIRCGLFYYNKSKSISKAAKKNLPANKSGEGFLITAGNTSSELVRQMLVKLRKSVGFGSWVIVALMGLLFAVHYHCKYNASTF